MLVDWKTYYNDLNSLQSLALFILKILVEMLMEIGKWIEALYASAKDTQSLRQTYKEAEIYVIVANFHLMFKLTEKLAPEAG